MRNKIHLAPSRHTTDPTRQCPCGIRAKPWYDVVVTNHMDQVTCKHCRKIMDKLPLPLVPALKATIHPGIVADYLEEDGAPGTARRLREAL